MHECILLELTSANVIRLWPGGQTHTTDYPTKANNDNHGGGARSHPCSNAGCAVGLPNTSAPVPIRDYIMDVTAQRRSLSNELS